METTHRVHVADSRALTHLDDASVEMVVTSPPYPMIEMWDDTFTELEPAVGDRIAAGDGRAAFGLMHDVLAETWAEVARVLVDGGIVCINIGDATRTVDGTFECYPNHVRITDWFTANGFRALPDVVWRKPTNSATKFMGSGMLPPNAYVTLEHEYILVFRKGDRQRSFDPGADRRYEAAYFWEERNEWFSDLWTDVAGTVQSLDNDTLRERSAAFPFAIPYRLINMYSVYGDTVLDPFWGTGTTSVAALVAGRNSVGYEHQAAFTEVFDERLEEIHTLSRAVGRRRLDRHDRFVAAREADGDELAYRADNYDVPVMTSQEVDIQLYAVESVRRDGDRYVATHCPVEPAD